MATDKIYGKVGKIKESGKNKEVLMNLISKFMVDEEAATVAEYALLLGLVLVAVTTIVTAFGTRINSTISNATGKLPT